MNRDPRLDGHVRLEPNRRSRAVVAFVNRRRDFPVAVVLAAAFDVWPFLSIFAGPTR